MDQVPNGLKGSPYRDRFTLTDNASPSGSRWMREFHLSQAAPGPQPAE